MANIDQQAAAQAAAQLAPVLAEIKRQTAEEQKRAANQQATAGASAQGLSQVLGEIPGRIQQGHQSAADSAFEYGRQLGMQFAGGSNDAAAGSNAFLQKQGSPQQVTAAGDAGGQVLGGLGGFIPGVQLQAQGAALAAGAEGLGAGALLRGQENQALIRRESNDQLSKLTALLRQEKGKLPGLTQDARAGLVDAQVKQRAQQMNEIALRSQLGDREFDNNLALARLKSGNQISVERLKNERDRISLSKSQFNLSRAKEEFDQLLGKAKFDLDVDKYNIAIDREARLKNAPKKGGFTPKQKNEMRGVARRAVQDGFANGAKPVDVLNYLLGGSPENGDDPVPFSIAIRVIQGFARRKDAPANWKATLGWTRKKR